MSNAKSKVNLDTLARDTFDSVVTPGRTRFAPFAVGIEVELEGIANPADKKMPLGWAYHEEPSLKDEGIELVTREAIPVPKLTKVLKSLEGFFTEYPPRESIRTSTHIHVNVANRLSWRSIYSVIGAWWTVENLLVKTQGPLREGNLFCLRLCDAESIALELIEEARSQYRLSRMLSSDQRYAALNLSALKKFGSLEFRFLRGMSSSNAIRRWAEALSTFVERASNLSWDDVIALQRLQPVTILRRLLPSAFARQLIEDFDRSVISSCLTTNTYYVLRLMHTLKEAELTRPNFGPEDFESARQLHVEIKVGTNWVRVNDMDPEWSDHSIPEQIAMIDNSGQQYRVVET